MTYERSFSRRRHHVIEGRRIILQQRQRVAGLEAKHLDATEANRILDLLLQSQRIFEESYASVRKAMGLPPEVLLYPDWDQKPKGVRGSNFKNQK
jgi:hypothetical protein